MLSTVSPAEVRQALILREEIALLDLREEAVYAKGHPLFASQIPAGRLEVDILDRIPRLGTLIVLYDNGEGLVEASGAILAELGYSDVRAMAGGMSAWRAAGYELFEDVNSYSKAFGELVEHRARTPSLPAQKVQALIDSEADIAIFDARRFEEYATMSIPTGTSLPGAELVMRASALAPDPATTIIVNCAGRTRSIIGTQSLINAGVANPVYALRNGTIGWTLAGQELETGQSRRAGETPPADIAHSFAKAGEVAYRAGVRRVDIVAMNHLAADETRTVYRFDVRTPEEYAAGHVPGFINRPGGQLVQEIDMSAPVRGARIVLTGAEDARADMTASWLAQMGWDAYVLDAGEHRTEIGAWVPVRPATPKVTFISAVDLLEILEAVTVIDLERSPAFRSRHIAGASWSLRSDLRGLLDRLGKDRRVVLTSADGMLAAFAAAELDHASVAVLEGGTDAWHDADFPIERGMPDGAAAPADVYRRPYEGTNNSSEAMQAYLDWEYGLVDQLARDDTHGFVVLQSAMTSD